MSDIHDLHKKLVAESQNLVEVEADLKRKLDQIKDLRVKNEERRQRIAAMEEELRDLVE